MLSSPSFDLLHLRSFKSNNSSLFWCILAKEEQFVNEKNSFYLIIFRFPRSWRLPLFSSSHHPLLYDGKLGVTQIERLKRSFIPSNAPLFLPNLSSYLILHPLFPPSSSPSSSSSRCPSHLFHLGGEECRGKKMPPSFLSLCPALSFSHFLPHTLVPSRLSLPPPEGRG